MRKRTTGYVGKAAKEGSEDKVLRAWIAKGKREMYQVLRRKGESEMRKRDRVSMSRFTIYELRV